MLSIGERGERMKNVVQKLGRMYSLYVLPSAVYVCMGTT